MPIDVTISLNPADRFDQFVVRILDSATCHGRSLHQIAALLPPVATTIHGELLQRVRRQSASHFSVTVGRQRLNLRTPLASEGGCNGVLFHVNVTRRRKSQQVPQRFWRDELLGKSMAASAPVETAH